MIPAGYVDCTNTTRQYAQLPALEPERIEPARGAGPAGFWVAVGEYLVWGPGRQQGANAFIAGFKYGRRQFYGNGRQGGEL